MSLHLQHTAIQKHTIDQVELLAHYKTSLPAIKTVTFFHKPRANIFKENLSSCKYLPMLVLSVITLDK